MEPFHDTDHHLTEPCYDIDGFGVSQTDMVDGEELFVVVEHSHCMREGCDAERNIEYLFTTESLADGLQAALEQIGEYDLYEHTYQWAEICDYDDGPIVTFESDEIYDALSVEPVGYCRAEAVDVRSDGVGECFGQYEEPMYEEY